jgi:hypothetical protein
MVEGLGAEGRASLAGKFGPVDPAKGSAAYQKAQQGQEHLSQGSCVHRESK